MKPPPPLVARVEIISDTGAKVVVKQLHLTDSGRALLRTSSTGIMEGVAVGQASTKKLAPA